MMQGVQHKSVKRVRKEIFASELGYKDESNPFGDTSLTEKFVWKKKNEYLSAAGLYKKTSTEDQIDRVQSKIREIHQVKKRRDEREVERQLLEQQRLQHDKEMHDEEYDTWVTKEEKFHLEAAKVRSLLRIEQGRERPMDLVAKSLAIAEGEEFEDMTILDKPPHQLFLQMGLQEVEDCIAEIEMFVKTDTKHKAFWKAMLHVCNEVIDSKQRERAGGSGQGALLSGLGAGVAEGVVTEIHELLVSKSKPELEDMLIEIKKNLQKGSEGMDTQFFDAVASKIPVYMARAEIEEWHGKAKQKYEAWLEVNTATKNVSSGPGDVEDDNDSEDDEDVNPNRFKGRGDWSDLPISAPAERDDLSPELEPLSVLDEQNGKGAYSPVLEPISNYDAQDLLDPDEDERILRQVRQTLIDAFRDPVEGGGADSSQPTLDRSRDDEMFAQERAKGMANDEVAFNSFGKGSGDDFHGEIELPRRQYEWEDKYRPRKPRFFNRVKTGFEWNKYNQTHYDHDNPPPKIVQGYKFNIFYPDLLDKTKAPNYYLEKSDLAETVTLRFHAGPPYEDVAFKIVNREWNLSHKFGFRVVFDRGVLQLYFNFKRWRYRR